MENYLFKDIYGILALIIVFCLVVFNLFAKKKAGKDWVSAVSFATLLFVGTALYYFALDFNNDSRFVFSKLFMILNGMAFTMPSFVGTFNFQSHLSGLAKESQIFLAAISAHFLAAVFMTSLLVLKLFGKKLKNEIRTWWVSLWKKYIVIGCDGQAKIFLKNLSRGQRQKTIVIIQSSQIDKKWELIAQGYSVVVLKDEKGKGDKFYYSVYRDALKKSGAMNCNYKTVVISMSEQDETNLLIAKIMADYIVTSVDPQIKDGRIFLTEEQEKNTLKMQLEVRVMYSFLERAEHYSFIENTLGKLMFFNPYKINAYKFWWENPITKLIPANWIDTEKAGLKPNVNSKNKGFKISTIFVGFGSTNQSILKTSIINNQLLNVDYNALVICQNAVKQEKIFKNTAIGLFDETDKDNNIIKRGAEIKPNPDGNAYLKNPKERNIIRFKEADALTADLYDIIINEIEGNPAEKDAAAPPCDYATVIIALGNDKLGIETAMELRQKLYEADLITGKNENAEYQRVKIFVKKDEDTILTDDKLLNFNADKIKCRINSFGTDEEVLTEEYIINEKLDVLAKNIANRYEGSAEKTTALTEWNTCTQHKRESNRYAAMAISIKLNLLGLDLDKEFKPENDYADLYKTRYGLNTAFDLRAERKKLEKKIELARNNEKDGKEIPADILSLKINDELIYLAERENSDFIDTPRNNLARLEHQRWNAFHLANDWTKLPFEKIGAGSSGRQDGIAKQHACITSFHGLIDLMMLQKDAEKAKMEKEKKKQFIEAESLLNNDTIRHDFNTMDFLLDLKDENLQKMRDAQGDQEKRYTGILTGSGYNIVKFIPNLI